MKTSHIGTAVLLLGSLASLPVACDWDSVDPRLAAGGAGGGGGMGGTTSMGGGEVGGGGSGQGGSADLDCGAADIANEDFEDPERDPDKWHSYANYSGSNDQVGGQLVMTIGVDQYAYNYYETRGFVNLDGRSVSVEVVQPPSVITGGDYGLEVAMTDGNKLILRATIGGLLQGYKVVDGGTAKVFEVPYNPANHRFWQLRITEDTAVWEASPDGADFTKLAEEPRSALFEMDYVQIRLTADNDDDLAGDTLIWDNVVASGPGTGSWCTVDTFTEDFSDPLPSRRWLNSGHDETATAKIVDGQLVLTPNDGQDSDYFYRSSRLFDVTGQGVSVELVEALAAPSTTFLRLASADEWVAIAVSGDTDDPMADPTEPLLFVQFRAAGETTTLGTVPYDAAKHRYLRIRDDAGTLVFETSPDGADWTVEGSQAPNPVTMDVMRIELGADATDTTPVPGQAIFDNVNILP